MITIYRIICERRVHYVGATSMKLYVRMAGHRSEGKLSVFQSPSIATIEEIEKVSPENARDREAFWISHYVQSGEPIENKNLYSSYRPPTRNLSKTSAHITPNFLESIEYSASVGKRSRTVQSGLLMENMFEIISAITDDQGKILEDQESKEKVFNMVKAAAILLHCAH